MDKDCIPYGSDVSAGTFECQDCGNVISMPSSSSLPPCNNTQVEHVKNCWKNLTGQGDAPEDPYPNE